MSDESVIGALQTELAEYRKQMAGLQARLAEAEEAEAASTAQAVQLREQAGLLDLTRDGIFVRSIDGTIRYWNRGAELLYGWTASQALGLKTYELLRTAFPVSFEDALARLQRDGHWEGELVHTRRDGTSIIVESRWALQLGENGEPAVLEINTDITEKKRAEDELQRLHEQMQAQAARLDEILSASPDHFYTIDRHGRYLYANAAAGKALGLQPAAMLGKTWRELGFPADILAPFDDNFAQVFATGTRLSGEVAYPVGQQMCDFEYQLIPMRGDDGNVENVLITVRDITDRKRAENELRASREQLQAFSRLLVGAIENERQTIARELHDEAGQALTTLKIGMGMLQRDGELPRAAIDRLEELKQLVDQVTDDLRKLALNLRPGALDRLGLVPAIQQYAEGFAQQTGLRIRFEPLDTAGERLPTEIETSLYRIVQEALTNVARHAQAREVGILLQRSEDEVRLVIEDDGVGFDLDQAARKGHLGLVGIRERAQMLGGTYIVETGEGQGTTVFVTVPTRDVAVAVGA